MGAYETTFDWVELPQGKARFSGLQRGWDERGRVTFAVEIDGRIHYGEIEQAFFENGNDYDIEVPTFGYDRVEDVGLRAAQKAFSADELQVVRSLVIGLIQAGLRFEDPPNVLLQSEISRFMGEIVFRDDWASLERVLDERASS